MNINDYSIINAPNLDGSGNAYSIKYVKAYEHKPEQIAEFASESGSMPFCLNDHNFYIYVPTPNLENPTELSYNKIYVNFSKLDNFNSLGEEIYYDYFGSNEITIPVKGEGEVYAGIDLKFVVNYIKTFLTNYSDVKQQVKSYLTEEYENQIDPNIPFARNHKVIKDAFVNHPFNLVEKESLSDNQLFIPLTANFSLCSRYFIKQEPTPIPLFVCEKSTSLIVQSPNILEDEPFENESENELENSIFDILEKLKKRINPMNTLESAKSHQQVDFNEFSFNKEICKYSTCYWDEQTSSHFEYANVPKDVVFCSHPFHEGKLAYCPSYKQENNCGMYVKITTKIDSNTVDLHSGPVTISLNKVPTRGQSYYEVVNETSGTSILSIESVDDADPEEQLDFAKSVYQDILSNYEENKTPVDININNKKSSYILSLVGENA